MSMTIEIRASVTGKIGFASHQNAVPVIRELALVQDTGEPVENLTLTLTADPPFLVPKSWRIEKIAPGDTLLFNDRDTTLDATFLGDLTEGLSGTLTFKLEGADGEFDALEVPVELLARNQWGGCEGMMDLLPAFVMPNDPAVDKVLKAASEVLRRAGKKDGIDGYEAKSRTRVWELSSAIWSAVCGLRLSYALPPTSFERNGQKVRTPTAILEGGVATCLDLALLFAATLEQAGLNPLVIVTRGHAFVGLWLQPVEFAALVTDESAALRRRIDLADLIVFETTLATQAHPPRFEQAQKVAQRLLAEDAEDPFEVAVDIRRARMQKIRPLALVGQAHAVGGVTDLAPVSEALEEAPLLPAFDVEVPEDDNAVTDRIGQWQRKLLNLTTSNRLLHVPDRGAIVRLVCPDPARLEDKLAEGKKIRIVPVPDLAPGGRDELLYEAQTNENLRQQVAENALDKNEVLALSGSDKLDAMLIDLYRKARSDIDEGGANTLFLAIGFLKWKKQPTDEKSYRAPLILLPVKLERRSALSGVCMVQHEDEPRFNLTLLELLRQDFELNIPGLDGELMADESGIDVAGIWTKVRRAIRDVPGFEVVPDVVLGTFSFVKYLMWKDLVDRADRLKESPIVRHLIERRGEGLMPRGDFPKAEELDDKVDPVALFTPLPADSSQLAAIVASADGHDFVLNGPPGTGKSQTIANMIAHNMALGRRVLFVSEKMAALSVVRRRLEEKGLGDFCLELHSNKATKNEVLSQLDRAWIAREAISHEEWAQEAAKVRRLRDNLNRITRLLHRTAPNGLTLHRAIGRVVRDWTEATPRLSFAPGTLHVAEDLDRFRDIARRLGIASKDVKDLPEGLASLSCSEWSNAWREAIVAAARDLPARIEAFIDARDALLATTGLPVAAGDAAGLTRLRRFVSVALGAAGKDARLAFALDWQERVEAAREAIVSIERYRAKESSLSAPYASEAVRRIDLVGMRANWHAAGEKFWLLRILGQRKLAKALGQAGGATVRVDPEVDLPHLTEMADLLTEIDVRGTKLGEFPGWKGLSTDLKAVEAHCVFIEELQREMRALAENPEHLAALRRAVRALLVDANDLLHADGSIARADSRLAATSDAANAAVERFAALAETPKDATYSSLRDVAEIVVAQEARLKEWTDWRKVRAEAMEAGLAPIVEALETSALPPVEARDAFETAYARWFASVELDANPPLRDFVSSVHLDDIEAFRRLDDHVSGLTVRYIRAKLCSVIPAKDSVTTKSDGFGILKHQLQLQRRHKPIRQLAIEMSDAFTRLAPCMLMSPLSIAQYLPPDQALFDLVIFDEASQITPWDAIGAMARGRQVVVAGDPRQMPPTNFFARTNATDGAADTEEDMESVLDQCLAAGIPEHYLTWHYRSRHESLIAFSNHRYYQNLVTFPAPVRRPSAVEWRRVDGVYTKGSCTNPIEAQAIVDEAVRLLRASEFNAEKKTLGIITMNADQQKLVEDLLDRARRDHPEIESHFSPELNEPVIIKNLETIQGDERDVILLTIGFGPTEPGSPTMSMNFGALSREGGHRRLNVAVTRARQEMVVFTSFEPGMIDLNRTNARAVRDLKHFIEFADRGPRALAEATRGSVGGYDSPFEEAVAKELIWRGWEVVPQIGVSRFRIDLGIVHPDRPGDYLVGVECDGAAYHSAATARDRDKVRAAILKGLGWNLLRIWSTDWWTNKQGAAEKLHRAIEALLAADREARAAAELAKVSERAVEVKAAPSEEEPVRPERELSHVLETAASEPERSSMVGDVEVSMGAPQYRLADFTDFDGRIHADRFYEIDYDDVLTELIAHVVALEAPISEVNLVQRIARAHGFQQAGRRIRERVMSIAIRDYHVSSEVDGTEAFIWPDAGAPGAWKTFRAPATEHDIRQIKEISLPELRAALNASLADDKAVDVARKFGIKRLSEAARQRLEKAESMLGEPETRASLARD